MELSLFNDDTCPSGHISRPILISLHNMLPFELTKDTPYLALSGELWSVFYEYFTEIDRVIKGFYCI